MAWAKKSTASGRLGGDQPLNFTPPKVNPLRKMPVDEPLDVGVRAINSLLTSAGASASACSPAPASARSALLGMMTRYTAADVIVVGLIGERGREVREFVEHILGAEGLRALGGRRHAGRRPPLMRLHGALTAPPRSPSSSATRA